MMMGSQARLRAFNARCTDAERLGHALLECGASTREGLCAAMLGDLETNIQALKKSGDATEVYQRSFEDLLRAMRRQKIEPKTEWRKALEAVVAADRKALEDQRASAAKARQMLQDKRDFDAWKAQRAEAGAKVGSTETIDDDVD